jgi:LysM repeat protein
MSRIDGRPVIPTNPAISKADNLSLAVSSPNISAPSVSTPSRDQIRLENAQGTSLTGVALGKPINPTVHTVKSGESLSTIAKKYFGNPNLYMALYDANRDVLKHPNQVHVGMELKLPADLFNSLESQKSLVSPQPSLNNYHKENPLSYITLAAKEKPAAETGSMPSLSAFFSSQSDPQVFKHNFDSLLQTPDRLATSGNNIIEHDDAVKVNKRFDLAPKLTMQNIRSEFPAWADKLAGILAENKTKIKLPGANGEGVTVDSAFFQDLSRRVKSGEYNEVKQAFQEKLGVGFVNTLFALDDVAFNMLNDPYYARYKDSAKTIDLNSVSEDFNLSSDKLNYLAHTAAHKHKQILVELELNPADLQKATTTQSADQIIKELGGYFNSKGTLTKPKEFETKVYQLLEDPVARRRLVEKFELNSEANLQALIPAITGEAGMASSQIDYNSYLAVGSVMMNRALGRNLKKAAMMSAQGKPESQFKPVSMTAIIREPGQFEIVWRPMNKSGGKTFYQFNQSQNQAFLNGKLKAGGNSHNAFSLAYEVTRDIFSGTNRLSAEVNGEERKGAGRSTANLFYFNQSRSQDYSNGADASVALIDNNNTQVYFKTWNKDTPYF